jgi:transposase
VTGDYGLEPPVREALTPLVRQLQCLDRQALADNQTNTTANADDVARRLMSVPGIGPVTASVMAASVQDPCGFASGRALAASLGLTPRQNSSGGKDRSGSIEPGRPLPTSCRAVWRRPLPSPCATGSSLFRQRSQPPPLLWHWGNKLARIFWAMMMTGEGFRDMRRSPVNTRSSRGRV